MILPPGHPIGSSTSGASDQGLSSLDAQAGDPDRQPPPALPARSLRSRASRLPSPPPQPVVSEYESKSTMPTARLRCHVSMLVNSDACPRPTTNLLQRLEHARLLQKRLAARTVHGELRDRLGDVLPGAQDRRLRSQALHARAARDAGQTAATHPLHHRRDGVEVRLEREGC
jgi:hypothetical protein